MARLSSCSNLLVCAALLGSWLMASPCLARGAGTGGGLVEHADSSDDKDDASSGVAGAALDKAAKSVETQAEIKGDKIRQRLEQLFIWRVSDRLSLTPTQESQFSQAYKKITDERAALSQDMENILNQLEKSKDNEGTARKLLSDYEVKSKKYNLTQTKEMDLTRRLFDTKKVAEYVLLKREMSHRFKDLLSQGSATSASKKVPDKVEMKEPQVFQEK